MKLLLDEMWPPAISEELRRRGHDVTAVSERAELRGQPDEVVFAIARAEGRAVLTENVADYLPLASAERERGRAHASLILTSHRRYPRSDPRTVGRVIVALDTLLSTNPDSVNLEYWLE